MDITAALLSLNNAYNVFKQGLKNKLDAVASTLRTHLSDLSNPHRVTKKQVGLGLVQNCPIATKEDMTTLRNNNAYVTPAMMGHWVDEEDTKLDDLLTHIVNTLD